MLRDEHSPLGTRQRARVHADVSVGADRALAPPPAVDVRARVERVGEDLTHRVVARANPAHGLLVGQARRDQQPLVLQVAKDLVGRAELSKFPKDECDGVMHGLVGRQTDLPQIVVVEPDRQALAEVARLGALRRPPCNRMLMRWCSASLIVPFIPSKSRSLYSAGS
jgi:hypothetical protein